MLMSDLSLIFRRQKMTHQVKEIRVRSLVVADGSAQEHGDFQPHR